MKKFFATALVLAFLGIGAPAFSQDTTNIAKKAWKGTKKGANKAWKGTKKGAKAVGNETAELASKGKAEVTDKTAEGWEGPNGEKIYVDDGSKYYWVSEKGKKMWISKDQLKKKEGQ